MKPPPISPILLEKYLRNECTPQEKEQVEAWYAALRGGDDHLSTLPEKEQRRLQEETFSAIQEEIHPTETDRERKLPARWLTGLAASLLLLLGIYGIYRTVQDRSASGIPIAVRKEPERLVQFVNRAARLLKHSLPDGSSVWLHADASIQYPQAFADHQRRVRFSGEGFFEIRKDSARPFLIQSGAMQIKVLGTSFNVKALANRPTFQVAVVTGRVEVTAPNRQRQLQQVILRPRQQAIFETTSQRLVASQIPTQIRKEMYEPVTIAFDNTPLDRIVGQLQKRFNVRIRLVNPQMASCLVSADFEQQPLPLILEMLCTALDATYTLSGSLIALDGPPCP